MPIPFKKPHEPTGTVGYLKFLPHAAKSTWLGALFVMNARGEPVEFAHARVRVPKALLWRADNLQAHCLESLSTAIFDACPTVPDLMLCLAEEVAFDLFDARLSLEFPIGRITPGSDSRETAVEWIAEPAPDSPSSRLLECLSSRGLLLEPFARAEVGLREVYSGLLR